MTSSSFSIIFIMKIFTLFLSLLATFSVVNAADTDTSKIYSKLKQYSYSQNTHAEKLRLTSSSQRLDSTIKADWINDSWQPYEKEEFFYDSENRLYLVYNYTMDQSSGEWLLNTKSQIEYSLNASKAIYYDWDNALNEFKESYLMETSFDDQGKKTTEVFYYHDGIDWLIDEKTEYAYYSDGNMKEEIQYYGVVDIWMEEEKTEYVYHAGQLLESEINYEYDGIWHPVFKENYIFNGDLPVKRQSFDYYGPDVDSFLVEELEFLFDINGNPATEIFSSDWSEEKIEYMYDLSYEIMDLTVPGLSLFIPQISANILNKPLGYTSYYSGSSGWEPNKRELYFYSNDVITAFDKSIKNTFKVFPNPAQSHIYLDLPYPNLEIDLKIYNQLGNIVFQQKGKGNYSFSVEKLDAGIYTVEVNQFTVDRYTERLIIR